MSVKLFRTAAGNLVENSGTWYRLPDEDWQALTTRDDLPEYLDSRLPDLEIAPAPRALLAPVVAQEVWAAGVTYYRSRTARMEESQTAGGDSFYDRVYHAERPELFFKSTPHRVAAPDAAVHIRKDSKWNVPEPELALLLSPSGKLTGYTIGNDMSSRDIEGENPLYLPQAKVYDRSCALGPGILVSHASLPQATRIRLEILRDAQTAFADEITIDQMKRTPETLIEYLFRENSFPNGCFLLTGTGIIPPDSFTLAPGDRIRISIDAIGTLENVVD
ncbi:MAG: fumarylacetoacetate hydrolase family protein [Acidobacteriaceae bacterium]|nr:fumarylacetoacetate hydrolase family protein [Acidobacteriaceae bacterium]